jgi:uncharacterized membrane protein
VYAIGEGIAPNGTIVGIGESLNAGLATRAFVWTAAAGIQELPVTDLTFHSHAYGVSDAGVIVGGLDISETPGSFFTNSFPVRWINNGTPEILPGGEGIAVAVNASGLIGGQVGDTAVLWQVDATMVSLGIDGTVVAVNDRNQALISKGATALLRWQNGQASPLTFPSDGFSTSLYCYDGGMNLQGWVVASCTRDPAIDGTYTHGYLWQATTPVDLNTLISAPGYIVIEANGINDFGMIVGLAVVGGQSHGVLLVPKVLENFPGLMNWLGL